MADIINFKVFCEAWLNTIQQKSRDPAVTNNNTYDTPQHFMKNSYKIGNVGDMELHASETAGGGRTHFTWNPEDKKIHHLVYAASATEDKDGNKELKYLSLHGRKNSPVRMGSVFKSLVHDHDYSLVGTNNSPGAKKLWDKMIDDPEINVHGVTKSGKIKKIQTGDKHHVPYDVTSNEDKEIGSMHLIARKVKKKNEGKV